MNKAISLTLICLLFASGVFAQDSLNVENPVEKQLSNIIEKSNDYQGFKVVDYDALISLKKNTAEYISSLNNQIITQKNSLDQQQDEINDLENKLNSSEKNLQDVTAEKDAINFLGMPFSKGGYMALMWGVVAILLLALIFFILRYKQGHTQTSEARQKLSSTEKEFEEYRVKALEKEQRLGRLLQDERNKNGDY